MFPGKKIFCTRRDLLYAALVVWLLTFLGILCDSLLPGRLGLFIGDFLPAVAAGALFYLMRVHQRMRARISDERVQLMREAIDHLRNAMQIVVYSCPQEAQFAAVNRLMQGVDSTLRLRKLQ